ncbi:MAG: MEDS domain-containing protein, partial [Solirubrobacterales bacterium]|nr:MEDS domain-containing protein [Solirubrobacterales bacterium]
MQARLLEEAPPKAAPRPLTRDAGNAPTLDLRSPARNGPRFQRGAVVGEQQRIHSALLYGSDEELLEVAIPFLSEGVAAGEPTIVKLGRRTQQLILDALGSSAGVTLLDVESGKALEALCRQRDLYARIAGAGYTHIRALAEPPQDPWRDWVRLEALANRFHADLPVWSVCTYDLRTTDPSIIEDARQTHPHLARPDQVLLPNPRFRDPKEFLAARARLDVDPAEGLPPTLRLIDPTS